MAALPYEILKLIVDQVEDSNTLFQLCLTSSWIRQLAEPLLYKTFNHSDSRGTKEDDKYRRWQLRTFIRTLILRPDLAFRVETVNIGYWEEECFDDDDEPGLSGTTPQTYEEVVETEGGFGVFLEALEAAGLFLEKPLADFLNRGLEEPLIALIFALCPNVQAFSTKAAPFMDYLPDVFYDMNNGAVSAYRPGNGSRIRTVSMGTNSMGTNPPSDAMSAPFLDHYWRLPNLETIHSTNIDDMSPGGEVWERGFSVVKNLNLEFACMSNQKLADILTFPIALKTLKLSWGYSAYGAQFSGRALGAGLSFQRHSLQELEVFDRYGLMTNGELRGYQDSPLGGTGLLPRFHGKSQAHILESTPVIDFMEDDADDEVILVNGEEKHTSDDLQYFSSGDGVTGPTRFKIGSLIDFSCLERVSLPSVYLLGQDHDEVYNRPIALCTLKDVVPESLIHLNIQNPHHAWVFLELKVLLKTKEWRTPKLRKVELTVSLSPRHLWEPLAKARLSSQSRETLQQLAIENEVELFIDPLL